MSVARNLKDLTKELPYGVELVLVSKTHPVELLMEAYDAGQRIFGENRPQEMAAKYAAMPKDVRWHMIGHLQTNKIRLIAPFVDLIHSADSARMLSLTDREAARAGRTIDVLLEIRVAAEETKEGWSWDELKEWLGRGEYRSLRNIRFRGVMGVATNTDDGERIRMEFTRLAGMLKELRETCFDDSFDTLSMGMTSDYRIAMECGSNMVRIGSLVFGEREYPAVRHSSNQ